MRNKTKRFLAIILTLTMVFCTNTTILAAEEYECVAQKTAEATDDQGRYKVEIQVPGEDGNEKHDEVIIMIDGSYSLDDEWTIVRNAILEIGKAVLEGNGNTVLTVMAFGMGDNVFVEHIKNVDILEEALPDLPEGLLYGRSSTNCEAGFTGIEEYINSHDDTLNDVHVVYLTDGEINTDETEYVFYNWTSNTWLKKEPTVLVKYALAEGLQMYEKGETVLSNAYTTVFGEKIYTSEEIENNTEISDEELMDWASCVWDDVYEYSGLNHETAYSVSDAERAFVKYDKENGTHIQEMFYYSLWGRTYSNKETRTINAGIELASEEKVEHMYLVDCNKTTAWMTNVANSVDNASFYESGSISNLINTLESVISSLESTPYNNVIINDYMSKWVNLDATTIKVVDNNKGETIWTKEDGWLISEERPTEQESPVIITEVSSDEYEAGGSDVVGNIEGTIYKLTWFVKDGAMVRSDNYSLVYEVDVDTTEDGFEYGKDYPANGNTTITYNDDNGEEITEDIEVPNVMVEKDSSDDEKPGCGQKPEQGNKPGCGQKPEQGNKPSCGQKPEQGNKPSCGQKPEQGNKPSCGQKPEQGNKPSCGQKPEQGNKPSCGQKPAQGNKPSCGQK